MSIDQADTTRENTNGHYPLSSPLLNSFPPPTIPHDSSPFLFPSSITPLPSVIPFPPQFPLIPHPASPKDLHKKEERTSASVLFSGPLEVLNDASPFRAVVLKMVSFKKCSNSKKEKKKVGARLEKMVCILRFAHAIPS